MDFSLDVALLCWPKEEPVAEMSAISMPALAKSVGAKLVAAISESSASAELGASL